VNYLLLWPEKTVFLNFLVVPYELMIKDGTLENCVIAGSKNEEI
jgi:hypothetical protein